MIIYHLTTSDEHLSQNDFAVTIKKYCDFLCIPCFLQQCIFSNKTNSFKHTNNLVFIDDNKYDVHGLFYSDAYMDRCTKSNSTPCFNSFLVSPNFVDSIKIDDHFVSIEDFSGFYYTNNTSNNDIMLLSSTLQIEPEILCSQKANNLTIETLNQLFYEFSQIFGVNQQELVENFQSRQNQMFSTPENSSIQNLLSTATELVGTRILKDKSFQTFDCASFLTYVYMHSFGIDITKNGIGESLTGKIMTSNVGKNLLISENESLENKLQFIKKHAKPGDILLFHRQSKNDNQTTKNNWYPGHVGIYIGDGFYVDARHRRGDVAKVDMSDDEYMNCFVGIKSIIEKEPSSKEISKQMS